MSRLKLANVVRRRWLIVLIAGLVLLAVFGLFTLVIPPPPSSPHPVGSYAQAVQRIEALQAEDTSDINPVCRLRFMTQGQKVERAIIFVHGYTNCPHQFHQLGEIFYDQGYNVLIARLPYHGFADRMTPAHAQLTAEDLVAYADEVVDIAQSLGDHVTMVGISGGGVATAWAAQHRGDLDQAVLIAPAFGFGAVPTPLTTPVMNLYLILPSSFRWGDAELKERAGFEHTYPRYSNRALAQTLRLGLATQAAIRQSGPAAQSVLVVTNANDTSVNNALTAKVVSDWRNQGATIETYEFEAELRLKHDLIDPTGGDTLTDVVYARLVELITKEISKCLSLESSSCPL